MAYNEGAASGSSIQQVRASIGTVVDITGTISLDNSIPQNTDGTQYLTATITPKNANNILVIQAVATVGNDNNNNIYATIALFQDSTANALACNGTVIAGGEQFGCISLNYFMTAGTTSSTTFNLRCGENNGQNLYINGANGTQIYGGVGNATLIITEYLP